MSSTTVSVPAGTQPRIRIVQQGVAGMFWIAGWLFTLGYSQPSFWNAVLALVLWPYYLGAKLT